MGKPVVFIRRLFAGRGVMSCSSAGAETSPPAQKWLSWSWRCWLGPGRSKCCSRSLQAWWQVEFLLWGAVIHPQTPGWLAKVAGFTLRNKSASLWKSQVWLYVSVCKLTFEFRAVFSVPSEKELRWGGLCSGAAEEISSLWEQHLIWGNKYYMEWCRRCWQRWVHQFVHRPRQTPSLFRAGTLGTGRGAGEGNLTICNPWGRSSSHFNDFVSIFTCTTLWC